MYLPYYNIIQLLYLIKTVAFETGRSLDGSISRHLSTVAGRNEQEAVHLFENDTVAECFLDDMK